MASNSPSIVWFRDDLRLADNPAVHAAVKAGRPVACIFVLDDIPRRRRGAARWWLDGSLRALAGSLQRLGAPLILRRGDASKVLPELAEEIGAEAVYWNRRYSAEGIAQDAGVEQRLAAAGIATHSFQASLLVEPDRIRTRAGSSFAVYTPFWRQVRMLGEPRPPLPAPTRIAGVDARSDRLADWRLTPSQPDWAAGLRAAWTPGEAGARARASRFLDHGLAGYATLRDRPDRPHISRLSPHLRFGEISPFQIWHAARAAHDQRRAAAIATADLDKFQAELGWREFAHHLLHRHPNLARQNIQRRFDGLPWRRDDDGLRAWQRGQTGYPIVDAGMRELWTTGFLHNRVRMIVASFLVKHLLIDWRLGESWFWDTLVDADPANNPAGWQWVAGCGADAAPYFRIFNPILQGQKFDPAGDYVRAWVPELAGLPAEFIHAPWQAAETVRASAGLSLGQSYPKPMVDHQAARARALAALATLKTDNRMTIASSVI